MVFPTYDFTYWVFKPYCYLIGGKQYINGEIPIGVIAEFILYVNMLTWPVAVVGWVTSMVQQAEASQKRINEFLNEKPAIENCVETETKINGVIEFNNLSFTYSGINILFCTW